MMGEDCKEDIIIVDDDIDEAYEDFEDRIYYNTLRDCVSQIVDDIKTLENGKISDIIRALNGDSTDHLNYNWSIVETSNQVFFNEDQLGMTNPTIQNGLSISRLNRVELSESTDMLYAQVIMHESYHAYLVNYIKVNNPPLFNPPDFQDYEYKDMIREVNIGIKNFNEAQHSQFIRDDMVGAMAAALLEYSQLKNYNVSLEFCKNLAWAGLQGTSTYNSLSNRNEIEEILEAEKISQNNGDQQPEGLKACQ